MGNSGSSATNGKGKEDSSKTAFRGCLKEQCVPMVQEVLQLRSASSATSKFNMVTVGHASTRSSFVLADAAERSKEVEVALVDCEKQCAKTYWPSALGKDFIGTVSITMVDMPQDQIGGKARNRV
eukprot:TRINITY_DN13734_c2_g2_i1.p1 TRINITY_DN13734_c2_g2~~TRINITY_DN13734_c2_g2_i1.p1  ORF type:complete len:125 (+),score=23.26 TRINITY_DN13734_c2_g2_i1:223-597(+)